MSGFPRLRYGTGKFNPDFFLGAPMQINSGDVVRVKAIGKTAKVTSYFPDLKRVVLDRAFSKSGWGTGKRFSFRVDEIELVKNGKS